MLPYVDVALDYTQRHVSQILLTRSLRTDGKTALVNLPTRVTSDNAGSFVIGRRKRL